MPAFSKISEVPDKRMEPPAEKGGTAAGSKLAYSGLLYESAQESELQGVEDEWEGEGSKDGRGLVRLRQPLPLEVYGPWLAIFAVVALLIKGVLLFLAQSQAPPGEGLIAEEGFADQIERTVAELNTGALQSRILELSRPTPDLAAKMSEQRWRFPKGHDLSLPKYDFQDADPAPNGARRQFAFGRTDGLRVRYLFQELSPERWVIDWESAVGYCEVDWQRFVENPPVGPQLMRVVATADDYFNDEFEPGRGFLCVKLTDIYARGHCFGYAHLNSEVGRQLGARLVDGAVITLTLSLEFPPSDPDNPGRSRNQVWIREMVSTSWFVE